MLNIALLGATGTAGSVLVRKILSDIPDCHLTLFARHAENTRIQESRMTVVNGDATKMDDLRAVLKGQDVVYSAISGYQLPQIAKNLVAVMSEYDLKRLIFMGAVGIYNEIPEEIDGQDNVDNEPAQVPNRQAVDVIEASDLNYTILRPGYLRDGEEDDFVLTVKGEPAKGYITTISSVIKLALQLIQDENLYSRESVSITREYRKKIFKKDEESQTWNYHSKIKLY